MDEDHYWPSLEYRICAELEAMPNVELRRLWCDGIIPAKYLLEESPARIIGTAWICSGADQEPWEFALILPAPVGSRTEIVWDSLLPSSDVTHWLGVDLARKRVEVEPGAASA